MMLLSHNNNAKIMAAPATPTTSPRLSCRQAAAACNDRMAKVPDDDLLVRRSVSLPAGVVEGAANNHAALIHPTTSHTPSHKSSRVLSSIKQRLFHKHRGSSPATSEVSVSPRSDVLPGEKTSSPRPLKPALKPVVNCRVRLTTPTGGVTVGSPTKKVLAELDMPRHVVQKNKITKNVRFATIPGEEEMEVKILHYEQVSIPVSAAPWLMSNEFPHFSFLGRSNKPMKDDEKNQEEFRGEHIETVRVPLPSLADDPDDLTLADLQREMNISSATNSVGASSPKSPRNKKSSALATRGRACTRVDGALSHSRSFTG